jgi:hypothetical protein
MAATRADISRWFDGGVSRGATHMIVVCDTYEWEDYPVYVTGTAEDARAEHTRLHGTNMRKVMEVYDLSLSKDEQMAERRAFHY